jgi:hypothetical protein
MHISAKALLVSLCTLLAAVTVASAAEPGKLLPTSSLSNQVNETARLFSESPPGATIEARRGAGLRLRDKISEFIIAQMQAMPEISQEQLRTQLDAILCSNMSAKCDSDRRPYVFTNLWAGVQGNLAVCGGLCAGFGIYGPEGLCHGDRKLCS